MFVTLLSVGCMHYMADINKNSILLIKLCYCIDLACCGFKIAFNGPWLEKVVHLQECERKRSRLTESFAFLQR